MDQHRFVIEPQGHGALKSSYFQIAQFAKLLCRIGVPTPNRQNSQPALHITPRPATAARPAPVVKTRLDAYRRRSVTERPIHDDPLCRAHTQKLIPCLHINTRLHTRGTGLTPVLKYQHASCNGSHPDRINQGHLPLPCTLRCCEKEAPCNTGKEHHNDPKKPFHIQRYDNDLILLQSFYNAGYRVPCSSRIDILNILQVTPDHKLGSIPSQELPRPILSRIVPVPGLTAAPRPAAGTHAHIQACCEQRQHNEDRTVIHNIDRNILSALLNPPFHRCPRSYSDSCAIV